MKRIYYLLTFCLLIVFFGCTDVDISVNEELELADISTMDVYSMVEKIEDPKKATFTSVLVTGTLVIDNETQTVSAQIQPDADISNLKLVMSISRGAKITPAITGMMDLSEPKVFVVTSTNGVTEKEWTLTVTR